MADVKRGTDHMASLDGLRALAVLGVVCGHAVHFYPSLAGYPKGADLGVDVFFVLSGYLITWLLMREQLRFGRVSLKNFYARRALRLFPALALVALVASVASYIVPRTLDSDATKSGVLYVAAYVGNWTRALGSAHALGFLGHTWSLAIEEQFYLIWPPVFLLVRRLSARQGAVLLGILAVVQIVWRHHLLGTGVPANRVYMGTDTHSDGLLWGCALALWVSAAGVREPGRILAAAVRIYGWLALGSLLFLMVFFPVIRSSLDIALTISALLTVGLLYSLVQAPQQLLARVLGCTPLQWVGVRSYGLYLWHYVIFSALSSQLHLSAPVAVVLLLALTLVLVVASYSLVEQPFLKKKARFAAPREQEMASVRGDDFVGLLNSDRS